MRAGFLLLVLAAGGIAVGAGAASRIERASFAPVALASAASPATIVYYFHATARCATCRVIEAWSHDAVAGRFAPDLETRRLEWRAVNVEEPANRHFIREFRLYTRSVVIVDARDPKRFKVLDRVWQLVRDKAAFQRYVEQEIRAFARS
jgi:hypothetical protein